MPPDTTDRGVAVLVAPATRQSGRPGTAGVHAAAQGFTVRCWATEATATRSPSEQGLAMDARRRHLPVSAASPRLHHLLR